MRRSRWPAASSYRSAATRAAIRSACQPTTGAGSSTIARRTCSTTAAYPASSCAPVHGAPHRPIPASAHGLAPGAAARGRRPVHWRSANVAWSASIACWAATRPANGPMWAATPAPAAEAPGAPVAPEVPSGAPGPSRRTSRTIDSRGYGSRVSRTQGIRSGNRERRL